MILYSLPVSKAQNGHAIDPSSIAAASSGSELRLGKHDHSRDVRRRKYAPSSTHEAIPKKRLALGSSSSPDLPTRFVACRLASGISVARCVRSLASSFAWKFTIITSQVLRTHRVFAAFQFGARIDLISAQHPSIATTHTQIIPLSASSPGLISGLSPNNGSP